MHFLRIQVWQPCHCCGKFPISMSTGDAFEAPAVITLNVEARIYMMYHMEVSTKSMALIWGTRPSYGFSVSESGLEIPQSVADAYPFLQEFDCREFVSLHTAGGGDHSQPMVVSM